MMRKLNLFSFPRQQTRKTSGGSDIWGIRVNTSWDKIAGLSELVFKNAVGSDITTGGTAGADYYFHLDPTYRPENAFDKNALTDWVGADRNGDPQPNMPMKLWYTFSNPITPTTVSIRARNGYPNDAPTTFDVVTFIDGNWVTVNSYTTTAIWGSGEIREFTI